MGDRINSTASAQLGLVTWGQATAGGLSPRAVECRVANGRWVPVQAGVYRVAGAPRSWEQDLLATCLAAGQGTVASHRSAAALWELDTTSEPVLEVSVVRSRFPRPTGVIVHRSTDLGSGDSTRRHGIPVTTPARTLVDLGAVLSQRAVELALERALSRRLVTLAGLRTTLQAVARRGRRGAGVLRALLDERSDAAQLVESVLEARFLRLCRDHGLPQPVSQHEVRVGRRLVGRVDFAYPRLKAAIEADGYEAHASLAAFSETGSVRTTWWTRAGSSCASPGTTSLPGQSVSLPPSPASCRAIPRMTWDNVTRT